MSASPQTTLIIIIIIIIIIIMHTIESFLNKLPGLLYTKFGFPEVSDGCDTLDSVVLMYFCFPLYRLFSRGKQEAQGRLLDPSEDVDDIDVVVDFRGYSRDKSQNESQPMTPL
jgi:hypothetical protein